MVAEKFNLGRATVLGRGWKTIRAWMSVGIFSGSEERVSRLFQIISLVILAVLFVLIFRDGLSVMVARWASAEYSHGYMIPLIAVFLLWRYRHQLAVAKYQGGAWSGTLIVVIGLAVAVMGNVGSHHTIVQYAFLVTLFGLALTFFSWQGMRFLWFPLVYLIFMIPLPVFLHDALTIELQLIAAQIGVAVIRGFGISVFLDGVLIDLGLIRLHVAEACSGLQYLFPLVSFGFLVTYVYQGPLWHKVVFFLSTIPIAIFMNSVRVGIIGVLVEFYGIEMAEGFLHIFEGWFIFMACLAILCAEIWLLIRISGMKQSLFDYFRGDVQTRPAIVDLPARAHRLLPQPFMVSLPIAVVAAATSSILS